MKSFRESRALMGMPITIEIVGPDLQQAAEAVDAAFGYFKAVDERFSTYKPESEISQINAGRLSRNDYSPEMIEVFKLSELTKNETDGYFQIKRPDGKIDPSGLVKGWAIHNAANLLAEKFGCKNFYVEAGGDIEARGVNSEGQAWRVGIRNPFEPEQVVKIVQLQNVGMATSGNYERGAHIYDPKTGEPASNEIVSLTVIGKNVYEADRFATAAYAMGKNGILFIEKTPGLEGYAINKNGIATMTTGFEKYIYEMDR